MSEPKRIGSRSNPKVQAARAVREGKNRELIFIEGVRLAEEAIKSGIEVAQAFITAGPEGPGRHSQIAERLRQRSIEVHEISDDVARALSDTKSPQGIFILAKRPSASVSEHLQSPAAQATYVYLFEISNPSNLGAVVRTAEAASVAAIFLSRGSADPYSPKSLRAAMGSAFRLPIVQEADFDTVVTWTSSNSVSVTALDTGGGVPYQALDWNRPRMVVVGSEAHGISEEVLERCDETIYIPMAAEVESLNLAVACGVVLFEAKRQREPSV